MRRYKLATDNHPAAGYATIDDIQGSGEFFMELGWKPQAATVSLAKQFMTPAEYIPTSGVSLYILEQNANAPLGQIYDIKESTTGYPGTTVSALNYTSLFRMDNNDMISPNAWSLLATATDMADQVSLSVKEFKSDTSLILLSDNYGVVEGQLVYSGIGSDVSAVFGLPALTKFQILGGITELTEVAEMVFVNGEQVQGDIYDYYYYYGTGAYDMTVEDGILYITFASALNVTDLLYFMVFLRKSQPELRVRYEDEPFDDNGLWLVYNNLPKGILRFNYYIR